MDLNEERAIKIRRFQKNMDTLRKLGGFTMETFGDLIGASKQSVSNLCAGRSSLSCAQYLAFRAAIEYTISQDPEKYSLLQRALEVLVDQEEDPTSEQLENIECIAAASSAGKSQNTLTNMWGALLGAGVGLALLGPFGIPGGIAGSLWLSSAMGKDQQNSQKLESDKIESSEL